MRILLLSLLFLSTLFAYIDSDLDGVEDSVDVCPNTPILEIVDLDGCSLQALETDHHYDILIGASYSQIDYTTNEATDTYTTSLQVDYFYKNLSLQASSSYYSTSSDSTNDNGLNDSILAAYYLFRLDDSLNVRIGGGVILPTYDTDLNNNNTDYLLSLNLNYTLDELTLFAGYTQTTVNDDDIAGIVTYQDSSAYSMGLGYHVNRKHYLSASYYQSESIFKGLDDLQNISIYNFYSLDKHWYTTFTYAHGLSDTTSNHYASINLGYYF